MEFREVGGPVGAARAGLGALHAAAVRIQGLFKDLRLGIEVLEVGFRAYVRNEGL